MPHRWVAGTMRAAQNRQQRRGSTMNAGPLKLEALPEPASPGRQLTATKLLVWGAFALLLYVAHAAFVPIALALLLALILSGPVEALHKYRVNRSVSAMLIRSEEHTSELQS